MLAPPRSLTTGPRKVCLDLELQTKSGELCRRKKAISTLAFSHTVKTDAKKSVQHFGHAVATCLLTKLSGSSSVMESDQNGLSREASAPLR